MLTFRIYWLNSDGVEFDSTDCYAFDLTDAIRFATRRFAGGNCNNSAVGFYVKVVK